jgi:hypothetical protein
VNGLDSPRLYDGATWTAITGVSTPAITGVTTTTLANVLLFKHRIWFIQKNTLKAWYLPTDSVGGVAQALRPKRRRDASGGYLVDMEAWTIDAGYGADDNLAFITSTGEVIVYRGTDPASAATWTRDGQLAARRAGGRALHDEVWRRPAHPDPGRPGSHGLGAPELPSGSAGGAIRQDPGRDLRGDGTLYAGTVVAHGRWAGL